MSEQWQQPYPEQPGGPTGPPAGGGRTPGKATASLILGIIGLLICPIVCSVLAIVFGQQAKQEIDADPSLSGRGMAQAGFILGIIGIALGVVGGIAVLAS